MLQQAYARFLRAQGARPATIRLRRHWLNRAARDIDLDTATTTDLIDWLGNHEWAPETRKSARAALRSFYGWAHRYGHRADDPSADLPPVRVPTNVPPRPTPTDVLQAALASASDRDRLMLGLAAFAGLRRTEIAELRWDAVAGQTLRITGKGGRTRLIPISPALAELLAAESGRRRCGRFGSGWRYGSSPKLASPFVFPGRWTGHLSPETVGATLKRCLGDWSGHTLRHRFATMAYSVQRDLLTVQRLLGHSKPETTARYAEPPADAALAAVLGAAA